MGIVNNDAMLDYIHETKSAALHIFEDRARITARFVGTVQGRCVDRLLLVASGTSYNSCMAVRHYFERILGIPVELSTSYDYAHFNTLFREGDFAIAVTQEGESTNTVDAIRRMAEKGVPNCVVTEVKDNTCTREADFRVDLDCGFEDFGPKTKGYVCSVLTLLVCALEWAHASGKLSDEGYQQECDKIAETIGHLDSAVAAADEFIGRNREELVACERAYVIGNGEHVATALEGSLKCLETVRQFYFSFEGEEFLHGPIASVRQDVYTFIIAPDGEPGERLRALYQSMKTQNEHVFLVGSLDENDPHVCDCGFLSHPDIDALEYIVPFQLLAYRTFTGKGMDLNVREYPRTGKAVPTKTEAFRK